LHPLADDRRILPIDRIGETLKAPDSFMLVVSYNPGYQNFLKKLKPSTRQRFISITFDFPRSEQEEKIIVGETGIDSFTSKQLVSIANAIRNLKDHDLEEVVSTRLLIYSAKLISDGVDPVSACNSAIVETLTDDLETQIALNELIKATFGR
jgi:nitric oxide reductase NorQ protein